MHEGIKTVQLIGPVQGNTCDAVRAGILNVLIIHITYRWVLHTCQRVCTTRNRLATKAVSDKAEFAAGLAPVPWKSLNAAVWLTNTGPVRFSDRDTPARSA